MKVFYALSTGRYTIEETYNKIFDNLNKKQTIIIDVDDNNNTILFEKLKESIDECDLFICDVTPEYDCEEKTYINSNVMLELGYAINTKK